MPRKPKVSAAPRYRAYKAVKMTDDLQTWIDHRFDMSQPLTDYDMYALRAIRTIGSPRIRILEMRDRLDAVELDSDPRIRSHVVAIRAILDHLDEQWATLSVSQSDLSLLAAADRLWFNIIVKREVVPAVAKGLKFRPGKPRGAIGPLRAVVRYALFRKDCAEMSARELWATCKALPEQRRRGIDFETDNNAYVPGHGNVSFRRFANIVSDEKKRER